MSDEPVSPLKGAVLYRHDPESATNERFVQSDYGIFGARALAPGARTKPVTREGADVFCFVKRGAARILRADGQPMAELGELDGIVIPAGFAYAIEGNSAAGETSEVLEFHASAAPLVTSYQPFEG